MTAGDDPSRELDVTPSLVRMHGVDDQAGDPAGDADNPSKRIRGALGVMYGSARTGGSLPSSDLDSPAQLVAAWTQYRDAYGNNGLASAGAKRMTGSDVDDELAAMAAAASAPGAPAQPAAVEPAARRGAADARSEHGAVAVESPAALAYALFQMV